MSWVTSMTTTENLIERDLISKLEDLKYTYRPDIPDRAALEKNFRDKFEALNRVRLTDAEFQRLLEEIITPDVFAAAHTPARAQQLHPRRRHAAQLHPGQHQGLVQEHASRSSTSSASTPTTATTATMSSCSSTACPWCRSSSRPSAISPRRAMEQIVDYKNDPGNGYTKTLLCFIQLFIVSNRTDTWYFANNNARHFNFNADERFLPIYQFAAEDNKKISRTRQLRREAFLTKCTLGQMISRYMVLIASEQKLMMMRPYQIYAVKAIVDCIHQNCGNGYIWHTTGSGKTLTSFKASTLLKDNPDIEKCLFVVDRKDLDRQTREEFNRFQEGCVEENTNTGALVRRLLSDDYADKVIVTTIQKLGLALDENSKRSKENKKQGRRPTRNSWNRCETSEWCSSSTNATARNSARTTRPSKNSSPTPSFSASPARRSSSRTPPISRSKVSRPPSRPRTTSSRRNCTPTPSPTPSRTVTSCAFTSITTSRKARKRAQAGRNVAKRKAIDRGHPRQARCRHRRTQVQRHSGYRLHQRRHRILRAVQVAPGRRNSSRSRTSAR